MAWGCQLSAVAAGTMVVLVLAAAIATLTSVIIAQEPPTPGRNCYRKCVEGDYRECHFNFDVHPYQTLSRACYDCPNNVTDCYRPHCIMGDGVQRRILVVNKQMPGPAIQVCVGDKVIVNVKNSLNGEGLTMHWHGITQRGFVSPFGTVVPGTPHMDGVPGVTQCPIHAGASFRYSYYATDAGTFFYHAHTAFHRGDGVFGSIIIRQPSKYEEHHRLYDYDLPEHVIQHFDWLHIPSEDKYLFRHHSGGDDFPKSLLVNGQGPFQNATQGSLPSKIPYAEFRVTPGNRYRMRLINPGILNCPIKVEIEDHEMTVIGSDGKPLVPTNTSSLVTYSGERWDIVLNADHSKSGTYWMSFMAGVDCEPTQAHQFAILKYENVGPSAYVTQVQQSVNNLPLYFPATMSPKPAYNPEPEPGKKQINSINRACTSDRVCAADLRSPYPMPEAARTQEANITLYLAFEMRQIHNARFYSRTFYDFGSQVEDQQIPTPQVNNLTFVHPPTPLLLTGVRGEKDTCSAEFPPRRRSCQNEYCECLHMYTLPLGAVVDMVFIDEGMHGDENHPIHLHGEYFWVLAQDRPFDGPGARISRSEVMDLDAQGLIRRNLVNPPYKDTVTIPDGGYSVVRILANNPGYWLMHCHLLFHSEAGMSLVLKIGHDSHIPPPPPGFPTCGNFKGHDL